MIIAIDGPAGAGKSTVARALARRLGYLYLDTGAMYRAVTLEIVERGLDPRNEDECARMAERLRLDFAADGGVLIDGRRGEPRIREDDRVARWVSIVAAHARIRTCVVQRQRQIASEHQSRGGLVAEGRDTATAVFPAAQFKFFLTAKLATRAMRRAQELSRPPAEVEAEIERRDRLDSTRTISPLELAKDSILVSTDGKTADQVTEELFARIQKDQGDPVGQLPQPAKRP